MSEQTKFRVKEIAYAYPTSPVADKFKFRNGCWYVGVGTCYPQSRALLPGPKEIKAFATFWEAHTFAETLVQPYSGYTWTPEKYAAVHPHETRPTGCRESAAKNERTK